MVFPQHIIAASKPPRRSRFLLFRSVLLAASISRLTFSAIWASEEQAPALKIHKGDSIVFMGNTFAERMHLFGYFETFLHARFPDPSTLTFSRQGTSSHSVEWALNGQRLIGIGGRPRSLFQQALWPVRAYRRGTVAGANGGSRSFKARG